MQSCEFVMKKHILHIFFLSITLGIFLWMDAHGKSVRTLPAKTAKIPHTIRVNTQKEIYHVYKQFNLHGTKVIHLNRFLNLIEYLPKEENVTMPFPIRAGDSRMLYEKGLDSHNWLFVANRTALVRTAVVVLPEAVFMERMPQFENDFAFSVSGRIIKGYAQDMPLTVTTLDALPGVHDPIVIDIDAGYFGLDEKIEQIIYKLRQKCLDIRMIVLSESRDEAEISEHERDLLKEFEKQWNRSL